MPPRSNASASRYESMLNLAFAQAPISIMCPYDTGLLPASIISQMHGTHPETIRDGSVRKSPDYLDPGAFILKD